MDETLTSRSDQECAKETVGRVHVSYPSQMCCPHCNDVTSFEVEHPACGMCELCVSYRVCWVDHSDDFVVNKKGDPYRLSSIPAVVNLFVDVVPSGDGHRQFTIMVLHAASKMAVRSLESPVFKNCRM